MRIKTAYEAVLYDALSLTEEQRVRLMWRLAQSLPPQGSVPIGSDLVMEWDESHPVIAIEPEAPTQPWPTRPEQIRATAPWQRSAGNRDRFARLKRNALYVLSLLAAVAFVIAVFLAASLLAPDAGGKHDPLLPGAPQPGAGSFSEVKS